MLADSHYTRRTPVWPAQAAGEKGIPRVLGPGRHVAGNNPLLTSGKRSANPAPVVGELAYHLSQAPLETASVNRVYFSSLKPPLNRCPVRLALV